MSSYCEWPVRQANNESCRYEKILKILSSHVLHKVIARRAVQSSCANKFVHSTLHSILDLFRRYHAFWIELQTLFAEIHLKLDLELC